MKQSFNASLTAPIGKTGFGLQESELTRTGTVQNNGHTSQIIMVPLSLPRSHLVPTPVTHR